ncbi:MAG: hypothetical protein FWG10_11755 [Eubacteriaceae bacterium]|nr:hypothetical protein [Eubacteriaceae bacterium]
MSFIIKAISSIIKSIRNNWLLCVLYPIYDTVDKKIFSKSSNPNALRIAAIAVCIISFILCEVFGITLAYGMDTFLMMVPVYTTIDLVRMRKNRTNESV